jgi:hypothetical protein
MLFCIGAELKFLEFGKETKDDLCTRCCGEYVDLQRRSNRELQKTA